MTDGTEINGKWAYYISTCFEIITWSRNVINGIYILSIENVFSYELFSPSKKQYTIRSGWLDSYSLAYTWKRFLGTNKFASFYPIDTII